MVKKCSCHKKRKPVVKNKPKLVGRKKKTATQKTRIPKKTDTIEKYVRPEREPDMFY